MNIKSRSLFIGMLLIVGGAYFSPVKAEAKGVIWNTTIANTLYYCWNVGGVYDPCLGWEPALGSPNVSVSYGATIINNTTSTSVLSGDNVNVGDNLILKFSALAPTDISWFGTGYSSDSPYGHWVDGAVPPSVKTTTTYFKGVPKYSYSMDICTSDNHVSHIANGNFDVYVPLNVSSPTESIITSGNLMCGSLDTSTGIMNCTVSAGGPINIDFNFSDTYGKFYYGYIYGNKWPGKCIANIVPLRLSSNLSTDYILNVPAQTISFNLTTVVSNNPPATPTVSCPPTAFVNTNISCSASSVDPDGDTIRYDYDWDNNGSVDQSAPFSGYVSSNTLQALVHSYITASSKTIKVRAVDSKGGVSGWGSAVTIVNNPTRTVSLTPLTSTITLGQNVPFSSTASFSDGSMIYHNLNWRKQGSLWNWEAGYTPVASATQSNYTFAATTAHNLSTTLTPTQTGTYDIYASASADGITWISSVIATITVSAPPLCTAANPSVAWNPCVTAPAQCVGNPSPRDVAGTQSGVCTDGATGAVFRGCTVYGQVCTVPPSAVCGDGVCNVPETLLTCPKDCKAKYQQF